MRAKVVKLKRAVPHLRQIVNLSALEDFHRVVAAGSLSKASRASGVPKASLSRHLRQLEEALGVRLVERGPRDTRLTEEGHTLYVRTHAALRDIREAGLDLAKGGQHPHGLLRISTPMVFADTYGGALAARFAARYAELQVELVATDRYVDLVEESFDLAVRVNPSSDSRLAGRCFVHDPVLVVASMAIAQPAVGRAHTEPTRIPAIAWGGFARLSAWGYTVGKRTCRVIPEYRLHFSNLLTVRDAVLAGAGAALLPESLVANDIAQTRLAKWGKYPGQTADVWVLYSSHRLVNPKVRAFVDFLREMFPDRTFPGQLSS